MTFLVTQLQLISVIAAASLASCEPRPQPLAERLSVDPIVFDISRVLEDQSKPDLKSETDCPCGCQKTGCECSSLRASAALRETSTTSRRAAEARSHTAAIEESQAAPSSDTRPVVTLYTAAGNWCGPCVVEDRKRDPKSLSKRPYRLRIVTTDGRDQMHAVGSTNYVISGVPAYVWMTPTGTCRVVRTLEALDQYWEPP